MLNLPLGKKFNVTIPNLFLQDDEIKKAIIRGIFDTEGGIYLERKNRKLYPRIYITTISFKLSEQLLESFKQFGLRATRHSQLYNEHFNRQRCYKVEIRGVEMFHKFIHLINPGNPKHFLKYKQFLEQAKSL